MKLNTLHITNFRCFRDFTINLSSGTNVIIGKNGSGKSALINALIKALSFVFTAPKDKDITVLAAGNPTLKVKGYEQSDFWRNYAEKTIAPYANIEVKEGEFDNRPISWSMFSHSTSKYLAYSKYSDAYMQFITAIDNGAPLPVLAYYSDSYPHLHVKVPQWVIDSVHDLSLPKNFAYYQWDNDRACTTVWETRLGSIMTRLFAMDNNIKSSRPEEKGALLELIKPMEKEQQFILSSLKSFSNEISYDDDFKLLSIHPRPSKNETYELIFTFANHNESPLKELPSGYRRLFSMMLDLSYRAFLLNGPNHSTSQQEGIVIIDEIDLHLHPLLENTVVTALTNHFPKIQFILSTHSAAVLSNLKNAPGTNRIMTISPNDSEAITLPNISSLDVNTILDNFMHSPSRNNIVEHLVEQYNLFAKIGLKEEMQLLRKKLEDAIGTDSEILQRLKTID